MPPKQIQIQKIPGGCLIAVALNDQIYHAVVGAEGEKLAGIAKALGDELVDYIKALAGKEAELILRGAPAGDPRGVIRSKPRGK